MEGKPGHCPAVDLALKPFVIAHENHINASFDSSESMKGDASNDVPTQSKWCTP